MSFCCVYGKSTDNYPKRVLNERGLQASKVIHRFGDLLPTTQGVNEKLVEISSCLAAVLFINPLRQTDEQELILPAISTAKRLPRPRS